MKAVLVIDIPNEYADRYNVNEMYVWNLTVQDKQGYEMFDLTTDKPSHLKPLPKGHGRLIDADELKILIPTIETEYKYVHRLIDEAPTIIEADTGEK